MLALFNDAKVFRGIDNENLGNNELILALASLGCMHVPCFVVRISRFESVKSKS